MLNNIQTIINKFDKEFPETTVFQHRVFHIGTGHSENRDVLIGKDIKHFLKDYLTSMLDWIEKDVKDKKCEKHNDYCECLEDENMPCDCGVSHHNVLIEEVINIINSHR